MGELAGTLNAMLASLEKAREAEHRFVGDASHELRTPLTALRGNAAYLARHGADDAVIADIEADAARLSALLDDLLALAREDAAAPLHREPVRLADLAENAIDRARRLGRGRTRGARARRRQPRPQRPQARARRGHRHRRRRRRRGVHRRPGRGPGPGRPRPHLRALLERPGRRLRARPGDREGDRRAPRRPRRGQRLALHARSACVLAPHAVSGDRSGASMVGSGAAAFSGQQPDRRIVLLCRTRIPGRSLEPESEFCSAERFGDSFQEPDNARAPSLVFGAVGRPPSVKELSRSARRTDPR